MEDNGRDAQENAGNKNVQLLFSFLDSIGISNKRRLHNRYTFLNFNFQMFERNDRVAIRLCNFLNWFLNRLAF